MLMLFVFLLALWLVHDSINFMTCRDERIEERREKAYQKAKEKDERLTQSLFEYVDSF